MGFPRSAPMSARAFLPGLLIFLVVLPACSSGGDGGTGPGETPAISLSLNPTAASVEQGNSMMVAGTLTRSGGFTGTVDLDVIGEPAGVTATVSNESTSGGVTTATITVEVGPDVPPGIYPLTVRGTGSGVSAATAAFTLTVTAAPGYELEVEPSAISIEQGEEGEVEVTVTSTNFSGGVDLSLEGPDPAPPAGIALGPLPAGVTGAFAPNPATASSTLTITVDAAVAAAVYTLVVRGMAEGLDDRTANLALTVTEAPPPPGNLPTDLVEISVGGGHACRLNPAGNAFCWGFDSFGQLGNGAGSPNLCGVLACSNSPIAVAGGLTFAALSTGLGTNYACALDNAGQAHCWGVDDTGALGDGPPSGAGANQEAPSAVIGNHNFVSISARERTTCALTQAGQAYCWGADFNGQVGNGGPVNTHQDSPVAVIGGLTYKAIAAGETHVCALDMAGKAYCWGNDGWGEIGDGAPVQVRLEPTAVTGDHTFMQITAGNRHTCAIDEAGQAWCWGNDQYGQLGDGAGSATMCGPVPQVDCALAPVPVAGVHVFTYLTAGTEHTCGMSAAGHTYCWGYDFTGQLGDDPALADKDVPVPVAGPPFRSIAAGVANTCGVDFAGAAWCWGSDQGEQLGDGPGAVNRPTPVMVMALPP